MRVGMLSGQSVLLLRCEWVHEDGFVEVIPQRLVRWVFRDRKEVVRNFVHAPKLDIEACLPPRPAVPFQNIVDAPLDEARHFGDDLERLVIACAHEWVGLLCGAIHS